MSVSGVRSARHTVRPSSSATTQKRCSIVGVAGLCLAHGGGAGEGGPDELDPTGVAAEFDDGQRFGDREHGHVVARRLIELDAGRVDGRPNGVDAR